MHNAFSNVTPDEAAGELGSWEEWQWNGEWGEWCLEVDEAEEKSFMFASRWRVREDGGWEFIGNIGEAQ